MRRIEPADTRLDSRLLRPDRRGRAIVRANVNRKGNGRASSVGRAVSAVFARGRIDYRRPASARERERELFRAQIGSAGWRSALGRTHGKLEIQRKGNIPLTERSINSR